MASRDREGRGESDSAIEINSFVGLSSRVLKAGVPSPAGSSHEQPPVPSPAAGHPGGAPFSHRSSACVRAFAGMAFER